MLALAGSSLGSAYFTGPRSQTSLVAHFPSPMRTAVTTPVGSPAAFLARFTGDIGLPRSYGGSTPTLAVSRPAQRSLALQSAWTTYPLKGPFLGVLQVIRRLLTRPECFRLEREFAGPDSHRGGKCTLARHTQQRRRTLVARRGPRPQELPVRRIGCRRGAGGGYLQPDWFGETQRPRSRSLSARGPHPHRRPSHQPHRRTSALEHQIHTCGSVHLTYSWTLSKTVQPGRLPIFPYVVFGFQSLPRRL
jgi:hypothetical protein